MTHKELSANAKRYLDHLIDLWIATRYADIEITPLGLVDFQKRIYTGRWSLLADTQGKEAFRKIIFAEVFRVWQNDSFNLYLRNACAEAIHFLIGRENETLEQTKEFLTNTRRSHENWFLQSWPTDVSEDHHFPPAEPVEPAQPTDREQRIQEAKARFYSEPRELHRPCQTGRRSCPESRMWIEPLSEVSWSVRVEYYHQSGVEFESMRKIDGKRFNSTLLHNLDFDIAQWVLGFNYRTESKSHRKPFREEIKASFGDWILEWDANN